MGVEGVDLIIPKYADSLRISNWNARTGRNETQRGLAVFSDLWENIINQFYSDLARRYLSIPSPLAPYDENKIHSRSGTIWTSDCHPSKKSIFWVEHGHNGGKAR